MELRHITHTIQNTITLLKMPFISRFSSLDSFYSWSFFIDLVESATGLASRLLNSIGKSQGKIQQYNCLYMNTCHVHMWTSVR